MDIIDYNVHYKPSARCTYNVEKKKNLVKIYIYISTRFLQTGTQKSLIVTTEDYYFPEGEKISENFLKEKFWDPT